MDEIVDAAVNVKRSPKWKGTASVPLTLKPKLFEPAGMVEVLAPLKPFPVPVCILALEYKTADGADGDAPESDLCAVIEAGKPNTIVAQMVKNEMIDLVLLNIRHKSPDKKRKKLWLM